MLRNLAHTTYDRFGESLVTVYQIGDVVNFPFHIANAFVRKGIAEKC